MFKLSFRSAGGWVCAGVACRWDGLMVNGTTSPAPEAKNILCAKVGKSYFKKSQKTIKSARVMICWFIALFYRNLFDVLHHSPKCCRSLGQWQPRCSRLDQWAVSWPSQQTGLSGLVVSGCDAFQIKSVFRGCWWSDLHMELIQYQQSTDINNCACGLWLIPILTKSFW